MTVDEVVKLILAISFAISLIGVSIQIMRLLGKVTDTLEDARETVKNVSKLSTMTLSDYTEVRKEFGEVFKILKNFKDGILMPILKVLGLVGTVTSFLGDKKNKKEDEEKGKDKS